MSLILGHGVVIRKLVLKKTYIAITKADVSCDVVVYVSNQTPLHLVASNGAVGGHPEVIRALLASGARVNQPDSGQQTALHKAVLSGSRDDVEALLVGGALPNYVDNMGQSPVHVAVKRKTRQPFDAHCCHMGTAMPDQVKPSFTIFDIRALRVPGCQKLQMTA